MHRSLAPKRIPVAASKAPFIMSSDSMRHRLMFRCVVKMFHSQLFFERLQWSTSKLSTTHLVTTSAEYHSSICEVVLRKSMYTSLPPMLHLFLSWDSRQLSTMKRNPLTRSLVCNNFLAIAYITMTAQGSSSPHTLRGPNSSPIAPIFDSSAIISESPSKLTLDLRRTSRDICFAVLSGVAFASGTSSNEFAHVYRTYKSGVCIEGTLSTPDSQSISTGWNPEAPIPHASGSGRNLVTRRTFTG